jgi:hypothetical protein
MKWIYMVLLVILIFGLADIFLNQRDLYLDSFSAKINYLLKECGYPSIFFQIKPSKNNRTYTVNKKIIYLNDLNENGERYNSDTILFVLLHEISHILSTDHHHTRKFFEIERKIHRKAIELGFLKLKLVDQSYPCH